MFNEQHNDMKKQSEKTTHQNGTNKILCLRDNIFIKKDRLKSLLINALLAAPAVVVTVIEILNQKF